MINDTASIGLGQINFNISVFYAFGQFLNPFPLFHTSLIRLLVPIIGNFPILKVVGGIV